MGTNSKQYAVKLRSTSRQRLAESCKKVEEEEKVEPIFSRNTMRESISERMLLPNSSTDFARINGTREGILKNPPTQSNLYCGSLLFHGSNSNVSPYQISKAQPGILPELLNLEENLQEVGKELIVKLMEIDKLLQAVYNYCMTTEGQDDVEDIRQLHNLGRTMQLKMTKVMNANEQFREVVGQQKIKTYLDSIKDNKQKQLHADTKKT